jgi:hypothetical protein
MKADTEAEVVSLLRSAGYWDDDASWRYYGDQDSNYGIVGNQASKPDVALVEKIVNAVDARLILECQLRGIDPEGPDAPRSIRSAVAEFFEAGSNSATAGLVREWPSSKRTKVSRGITLAATGNKPSAGKPCFTISDCGEGQTPSALPDTILSLHKKNKIRIPFVQGKFNMGGSGVLEFCGENGLQLVLSRRAPRLLKQGQWDPTDDNWGFTIVRREDPVGGRRLSVFTYLAPLGSKLKPRQGDVLAFEADSMPIFPVKGEPYARDSEHGTLIKLYEYSTEGYGGSNILLKGLLDRLDLRLANVALPIRLHECRGYSGKSGSFDTTLSGIQVRLDDDRARNLEDIYSCSMSIDGQLITGSLYIFKKGRDTAYRQSEGVIFTHNGQSHGSFSKTFFSTKRVNMGYLKNSILVILNCDNIEKRQREKLFMPSRDRLRDTELRGKITEELAEILKTHPGLRALREKRQREEAGERLRDSKPLATVLDSLIKKSPKLASLFDPGIRLSDPFKPQLLDDSTDPYKGNRYPSFFKLKDVEYGNLLTRGCPINVRPRLTFETDAVNDYFSRSVHPGVFSLCIESEGKTFRVPTATTNLSNGIASLNLELPPDCKIGDEIEYVAEVSDYSRVEPFVNRFLLIVVKELRRQTSKKRNRRNPPGDKDGRKREKPAGISLPNVIQVFEESEDGAKTWDEMDPPFNEHSALRVISHGEDGSDGLDSRLSYDFYVNMDNFYLKHDLKRSTVEPDLTRTQFANALVLIGVAMIQHERQYNKGRQNEDALSNSDNESTIEDEIEKTSQAIAYVILPLIEVLSDLTNEDIEFAIEEPES